MNISITLTILFIGIVTSVHRESPHTLTMTISDETCIVFQLQPNRNEWLSFFFSSIYWQQVVIHRPHTIFSIRRHIQ